MANGEFISLDEASKMTSAYRRESGKGDIHSHLYDSALVKQIVDKSEGLRIYHGIEDGKRVLVLVGTDKEGNDLTDGLILERGLPCPPICPGITNKLNSDK